MHFSHPGLLPRIDDRDLSRLANEHYLMRQTVEPDEPAAAPDRGLLAVARSVARALPARHRGAGRPVQHP